MGPGSLLLILALLVLVGLVIAQPLMTRKQGSTPQSSKASQWLAERERALNALLELDFDLELGKVPEDIYAEQRRRLAAQAAAAMQALDELGFTAEQVAGDPSSLSDDELEALLAARKKARS